MICLIIKSKENTHYTKYRFMIFVIGLITIIISEMTIRFVDEDFFKNLGIFIIPVISIISLYLLFLLKFKFIKVSK